MRLKLLTQSQGISQQSKKTDFLEDHCLQAKLALTGRDESRLLRAKSSSEGGRSRELMLRGEGVRRDMAPAKGTKIISFFSSVAVQVRRER